MRRAFFAVVGLLAALPSSAHADTNQVPKLASRNAMTIVVDAKRGRDANPGTAQRPLKSVAAAWERVPQSRTLKRPVRILVRPGRYGARALPNYWESRWGTERAPIVLTAAKRGTVTFAAVNLFDLRWVAFDGITFSDHNDLFHCERCQHLLLTRSRLVGSANELHENVKVNQSQHVAITDSVISGADDNAIDFVAVQHARVTGNVIEKANDWCAYAKGGSAFVLFARNRVSNCGTGGFTAGQGTGMQFMTAPFIRYEAYGIEVLDNTITNTEGAGIGVNGGYNVVVARNRMFNVGARSHWVEVGYGSRSCDGQPGDEGRERCAQNLAAGGWGTTRVDDGSNYVRIPNRHVWILGNVIDNPQSQGDQLFSIAAPFDGGEQIGSGLAAVRADDDLTIAGNLIAGRGLPIGAEDCERCPSLMATNTLSSEPGLFISGSDLRLRAGITEPAPVLPALSWDDSGGPRP